ncbi:hypothetical protein [Nonomuraea sp. NPDC023979]|uniref:hypothetical protein n=1 Tax=Nonomuraea sp. NPDC023979 TaxID=3154796 RepID=UPI0033C986A8
MQNGVYVALALCIALILAFMAGIAAYALGTELVAAFAWFGGTFLGMATLGIMILSATGVVGRKP